MTARLRLDLVVRTYDEGSRWTWRLWSGSRIVSSSGSQLYSRRIDCVRGAKSGAAVFGISNTPAFHKPGFAYRLRLRATADGRRVFRDEVAVRILDERTAVTS